MQDLHEMEENLRVIRRLMERGQRYEAITGRGALLAGTAALLVAGLVSWIWAKDPWSWGQETHLAFLVAWPALAIGCALWLVRAALRMPARPEDDAARRLSSAARAVIRAVLPAYALAFALGLATLDGRNVGLLPGAWIALHGVAILATSFHAPRRLVVLGWIFLGSGCLLLALTGVARVAVDPNAAMALGFGGLHLAYGLFSVLRPLPSEE